MSSQSRSVTVLVPGKLRSRTGGYGYDRRIIAGLRRIGWTVDILTLDGSYPLPSRSARARTMTALGRLGAQTLVLADGLAFGAMAEEAEAYSGRLRFVALVHHPLATETGLTADAVRLLFESERRALACASAIVVTSHQTVASLQPYGVETDRVSVIEPGTDRQKPARGSSDDVVGLICVASVSPRKGHEVLVDALARLKDLRWHPTCVGDTGRTPETVNLLREQIAVAGLQDRISLVGERGSKDVARYYRRADLFVLPTRHEGYGMAVAEALAFGLPVVATPVGAIADLIGEAGGILVPVDDADALSRALRRLISDPAARVELAARARAAGQLLPTWEDAAVRMSDLLSSVSSRG